MPEIVDNLISTIIPVFNRPRLLQEAVASVLAQTYRPIEIIISDDGSTDETPQVIAALSRQHAGIIQAVRDRRRGPGPARESGRELVRGEFIQYLDSDDRLLPGKFEVQVRALRDHPHCGVAYGSARVLAEGPEAMAAPRAIKWSGHALPTLFPWLLIDRWWSTHAPLYRRSVCEAVGPWTDLPCSEDWEYDGRVGALRTRLVHCPEFVAEYRCHAGPRQTGNGRWLAPRDRVRFFSLMLRHARAAGVAADAPERRHFSRWVFLSARECGAAGDADAARQCFALAVEAVGGETHDLRAYRCVAGAVGWCAAGRLSAWLIRLTRRRPGPQTLPLSDAAPPPQPRTVPPEPEATRHGTS